MARICENIFCSSRRHCDIYLEFKLKLCVHNLATTSSQKKKKCLKSYVLGFVKMNCKTKLDDCTVPIVANNLRKYERLTEGVLLTYYHPYT